MSMQLQAHGRRGLSYAAICELRTLPISRRPHVLHASELQLVILLSEDLYLRFIIYFEVVLCKELFSIPAGDMEIRRDGMNLAQAASCKSGSETSNGTNASCCFPQVSVVNV